MEKNTIIQEGFIANNKTLLKITNILGQSTQKTNQPLLYIYDDGTVEKNSYRINYI